jgi:hypothetical protein
MLYKDFVASYERIKEHEPQVIAENSWWGIVVFDGPMDELAKYLEHEYKDSSTEVFTEELYQSLLRGHKQWIKDTKTYKPCNRCLDMITPSKLL